MKYPEKLTITIKKNSEKTHLISKVIQYFDIHNIKLMRKPNDPRSGKNYKIIGFKNYTQELELEIEIQNVPKKYYKSYKQIKNENLCKTNNKHAKIQFAHL